MIRTAHPDDAPMLARLHLACWRETYAGLLPEAEIAARPEPVRLHQWTTQLAGSTRIAVAPDLGFAQMGPQRDSGLAAQGYAEELYCIYLLRKGHGRGVGRALLDAVRGAEAFTALVLDDNITACRFYEHAGGRHLETRPEHIGIAPIAERIYGFAAP